MVRTEADRKYSSGGYSEHTVEETYRWLNKIEEVSTTKKLRPIEAIAKNERERNRTKAEVEIEILQAIENIKINEYFKSTKICEDHKFQYIRFKAMLNEYMELNGLEFVTSARGSKLVKTGISYGR